MIRRSFLQATLAFIGAALGLTTQADSKPKAPSVPQRPATTRPLSNKGIEDDEVMGFDDESLQISKIHLGEWVQECFEADVREGVKGWPVQK